MTPHTWTKEVVDGGPMGVDDFWRCETCGCSGGLTVTYSISNPTGDRSPTPFLPGPAYDLSLDCEVAKQQVQFYIHGYLRAWSHRIFSTGENSNLFHLLWRADQYTPSSVPRIEFAQLMFDCDDPKGPQTIESAQARLLALGFSISSSICTHCGKETTRRGDDKEELCYSCSWKTMGDAAILR